jgi:hypothetical protein
MARPNVPFGHGLQSGRTWFVDATLGLDTNSGSAGAPIQTIGAVNALALKSGDQVLFKRGETWAGTRLTPPASGTPGGEILFGAYGSGARPIIGAVASLYSIDAATNYTFYRNLHFLGGTDNVFFLRGSHIVLDDVVIEGDGVTKADGLRLWGATAHHITVMNCESKLNQCLAGGGAGIMCSNTSAPGPSYVTFLNTSSHNNGTDASLDHGFYIKYCDNITLSRCPAYSNTAHGIQVQTENTNILVDSCAMYLNGNKGLWLDGCAAGSNVRVINNDIYTNVKQGLGLGTTMNDASILHNTVVNNATTKTAYGIQIANGAAGNIIKNNLFVQDAATMTDQYSYPIRVDHADVLTANTIDYNIYRYVGNTQDPIRMGDVAGTGKNFAQWQAMTGTPDAHGAEGDPLLVTAYTNRHLAVGSPAIALGDPTVGVLFDYDGVARGAAVDAGCYEYVA